MKINNVFLTIAFLLCSLSLFGQAETIFVLGAEFGNVTVVNDSTFQVNIEHEPDQLGQGYLPTQIVPGYECFDINGRLFRVSLVVSANFGESVLQVVELQDNNIGPIGVGIVYEKAVNSDCVPIIQQSNTGLSPALVAKIHNHNTLSNCGGGTDDQTASEVSIDDAGGLYIATDVEAALQEEAVNRIAVDLLVGDLISLTGVPFSSTTLGSFVNPLLLDNEDIKAVFEALADSVDARVTIDSDPNTYYISPRGNDSTGEKGNRYKPYQTYYFVRDIITSGETAHFLSGLHLINYNADLDLSVGSTEWYISQDAEVRIDPGSNNPVITMADGESFKITGPGKINFRRYFAIDPVLNTTFELSVDNVDGIGYILRAYQAFESVTFRIKNLTLTARPFCRISYLQNASVVIDIENFHHTNTNTGADYPAFLFFDNHGTDGSNLSNSTVSINADFVKTNATVLGINVSGANGSAIIKNCDISVNLGVVDQTEFISRPFSGASVASMGGSNPLTVDTSLLKVSVGTLLGDQAVFNFAGASAFGGITATDSDFIVDCSVRGRKNIVGSRDQVGVRNNTGVFTRSKLKYFGNSTTTDSVAVQFGTGWNVELSGSIQANSVPIRSGSDILARSFLATNKLGGELLAASSAINLDVCSSNLEETTNVTFTDLCGYTWFSEVFTATAAQTDFTVSQSKLPGDGANVRVYDDTGAKLRETDHYTYVASTGVVTLVTPATAGEKYTIEYFQ